VPLAETPSRTAAQRCVANALVLPPDDEELNSIDQMLKDSSAQTPIAWIRGCATNGDLGRLLNAAPAPAGPSNRRPPKPIATDARTASPTPHP